MDPATLQTSEPTAPPAGPGELVLQNGRQAGSRRALLNPATFLGRESSCDIRLNVDGVDPLHCVILCGPDGIEVRDLNSMMGTFVNGQRVEQMMLLSDGDVLKVGPFQFKLEITPISAADTSDAEPIDHLRDALRIQTAAVAAQQIALDEEEARLRERRQALQQQEEQLAAHLAEKQRQIQLWSDYTKSERDTLRKQKADHEKQVAEVEQELTRTRQQLHQQQQKVAEEKQRIDKVYQRLRQRWHKQWGAEKEKVHSEGQRLQTKAEAIEEAHRQLEVKAAILREEIARFKSEREAGLHELDEGRLSLENAQQTWRRRRTRERLAIKAKLREIEEANAQLQEARQLLMDDKDAWRRQQRNFETELQNLNRRIIHQRSRVQKHEDEIARLDRLMRERRNEIARLPQDDSDPLASAANAPDPGLSAEHAARIAEIEQLNGELADQRVHLLEQYHRLIQVQESWNAQREQAAGQLEELAQRLIEQEQQLAERDEQAIAAEEKLRERHEEIEVMRQEIQVWRAQMRARDKASADEHGRLLLAVREKESLLQQEIDSLAKLRQRWKDRRQEELEQVQATRGLLEQQQKEVAALRSELYAKLQEIEEQKRIITEKALALEQYKQQTLGRTKDPIAEKRVERLRRRWLAVNAALIRNAKTEHEAARNELTRLEGERVELALQIERFAQMAATISDRQNLLDEREAELKARLLRLSTHEMPRTEPGTDESVSIERAA